MFKDAISGKFIWWHFINAKEKLEHYELGFKWCRKQGYIIKGVVSDGFKGLAKMLYSTHFQICQVHIQRAVMKKLTRRPKSTAGMELLALSKDLFKLSKDKFKAELESWQEKHKDFLNEKTIDESGKWRYTHAKVRLAYYTFKRNLAYLFTYESVENLPKTNNGL